MRRAAFAFFSAALLTSAAPPPAFGVVIRGGTIYDGSGDTPYVGDVAIKGDKVAAVGKVAGKGAREVDAKGLAVAPGFINMLSWATESLIADGKSQSDIRQGVTLEVMGEGESMGPLNERMKNEMIRGQKDIRYDVSWNTLGEYLEHLEKKGVSCNVASFVGAAQVRDFVIGEDDRDPTPAELDSMKALVDRAMQEGAMGVSTSLIYPPGFFAKTPELIALCREAARYHGMYISHMRSEGNKLTEAVDELLTIARDADINAEIFHLKAAGRDNWNKLDTVIKKIELARRQGLLAEVEGPGQITHPIREKACDAVMLQNRCQVTLVSLAGRNSCYVEA